MFALLNKTLGDDAAAMAAARGTDAGPRAGPSKISSKRSTLERLSKVEKILAELRQEVNRDEGDGEQEPPSSLDLEGEIT